MQAVVIRKRINDFFESLDDPESISRLKNDCYAELKQIGGILENPSISSS